jgi:single-strand DNA-binding protein
MNTIQIVGRLTKAPDTSTTKAGKALCRMRIAIPRPGDNAEAIYIDVVAWERLAESCGQYLAQGYQVAVAGRLEHSEWTDNEGTRHSRHEIVASGIDFLNRPNTKDAERG